MSLLIRGAQVGGRLVNVRIAGERVREIGQQIQKKRHEEVLDADGGALIPGLHDHHVHLRSLAASLSSTFVGPSEIDGFDGLAQRLRLVDRDAPRREWIRAYGYHESVAGRLDRHTLDAIVADRPIRVQHRSGAAWFVNSAAIKDLRVEQWDDEGVERGVDGEITGALLRLDHRIAMSTRSGLITPTFANIGLTAASRGVTGFTDADPCRTSDDLEAIAQAQSAGDLPQRVHAMGPVDLEPGRGSRLTIGPVKIVLDDFALPTLPGLTEQIQRAHLARRAVAVHCVTRVQLVLTITALERAGVEAGDRIEHASVVPMELVDELARMRLTVVTQPGFLNERGDEYLSDVEPHEIDNLYRCSSLLHAGVPIGFGTDAPYGSANPWVAINGAVDRRTASGIVIGPDERVSAIDALALFLGSATQPEKPRSVRIGADADLCLLRVPIVDVARNLSEELVAATVIAGEVVYYAP